MTGDPRNTAPTHPTRKRRPAWVADALWIALGVVLLNLCLVAFGWRP